MRHMPILNVCATVYLVVSLYSRDHNSAALSRLLDAARKSSTRPPNVPTVEKHAGQLNELDASRISLAKATRDVESSLASKEAELAALKVAVRRLEESDPAQDHQRELDGLT